MPAHIRTIQRNQLLAAQCTGIADEQKRGIANSEQIISCAGDLPDGVSDEFIEFLTEPAYEMVSQEGAPQAIAA